MERDHARIAAIDFIGHGNVRALQRHFVFVYGQAIKARAVQRGEGLKSVGRSRSAALGDAMTAWDVPPRAPPFSERVGVPKGADWAAAL